MGLETCTNDVEYLSQRFYRPSPRLALSQELIGLATACIDVSDGLLADVGHLASASGVAITIESARVPLSAALQQFQDKARALRWALVGGDDYELCFTLPDGEPLPTDCSVIGEVTEGEGISCDIDLGEADGYQHF